ncbi:MAG: DUF2851 family protein [Tenuifilaceae bacterium]|jgi:hypothetical protein|nr:DUF2851 family protein [Tenuifilaceae bacterium]
MTEDILHFVWKHINFIPRQLLLSDNERLEVISPGEHNFDSGPDFFNAKIRIGNTLWAGNVEIHINASDWNKHGHQNDAAYDSVILHIVGNNDVAVFNSKGNKVKTATIDYPNDLEWELQRLVANEGWIPCAKNISSYGELPLRMWLAALAAERLEQKTEQVNNWVSELNGSWEEAFYISMARSFGLKINALPFELLAKSIPLKILAKIRNNLLSLEALLFGQAGMLQEPDNLNDTYYQSLQKEYEYLRKAHSLTPIPHHLWKFMRLRPMAFPTIRIAQLASLIHKSYGLFSKCIEIEKFTDLTDLLRTECSSYWHTHYTFGKESAAKSKLLGKSAIATVTLNTVVPFMFAYGDARGNQALKDKALGLLDEMPAEKNSTVQGFANLVIAADSALFSQAMVQLKSQYCDKRKCLYCKVGASVLLKKSDGSL